MKYEQFIRSVQKGIERIVKEELEDGVVVIRNVMKNNNVSMKAVSIIRKGESATPTIYLKEYYKAYKAGKNIEDICREIFRVYVEGIKNFKKNIDIKEFSDFEKMRGKIFYKLINYGMNEKLLSELPHFKFLDLAIVFYIMVECNENGNATSIIYNHHLKGWNITKEELKKVAFHNTWEKYPAVIQKMEDVISDMILEKLWNEQAHDEYEEEYSEELSSSEDSEETDTLEETLRFGKYTLEEVQDVIKEEVSNLKAEKDMDMHVLTNKMRFHGATCITYPGVLKEFAEAHECDLYIIPSSVHEVILMPSTIWEPKEIDEMIAEVNKKELDPVDVLSDHIYIFNREDNDITY